MLNRGNSGYYILTFYMQVWIRHNGAIGEFYGQFYSHTNLHRIPPFTRMSSIPICIRLSNYHIHPMLCQYGVLWQNSQSLSIYRVLGTVSNLLHMQSFIDSLQWSIRMKLLQTINLWNEDGDKYCPRSSWHQSLYKLRPFWL